MCREYYSPLVAVAYNVLRDHQLAEDAVQEAFVRGFVDLGKLKKVQRFAPWLARICRNVAIDMVRIRARQGRTDDRTGARGYQRDEARLEMVRQAIDALPVSLKEVVILRYYDNCSYEKISAVLGLSRMTINGRLTRAKRKLAKQLRQEGVLEDMP